MYLRAGASVLRALQTYISLQTGSVVEGMSTGQVNKEVYATTKNYSISLVETFLYPFVLVNPSSIYCTAQIKQKPTFYERLGLIKCLVSA